MVEPQLQRAIQFDAPGGPEVMQVREIPIPTPKPHEVCIRTKVVGINYVDTYFRSGLWPSESFPRGLGIEGYGFVESWGEDVKGFEKGDEVVYLGMGAFAEYNCTVQHHVAKIPPGISIEQAVGSLLQGITALSFIQEAYTVKKNEIILLHAAAGGTQLIFLQLLKAVGAVVIATASTEEKLEIAKAHGADHLVNYSNGEDDWVQKVLECTPNHQGVDAVYDGLGKTTFEGGLKVLKRKGRFVSYGNASGAIPPFQIGRLATKNVSICRPTVFGYIETRDEFDHYANQLFELIKEGKLKITISKVWDSLDDVVEAHRVLEGRLTTGKMLVKI